MKTVVVIMNHKPTDEQVNQLCSMGYREIKFLQHPRIPPEWDMEKVRALFSRFLGENASLPDALWVQGDYRFFAVAIEFAKTHGIPLYVATTNREVAEQTMPDGSVRKVSVFRHVRFVRIV